MKTPTVAVLLAVAALSMGCALAPRPMLTALMPGTSNLSLPGIVCSVAVETLGGVVFQMAEIGSERSIKDVCEDSFAAFVPTIREREVVQAKRLVAGQHVRVTGKARLDGVDVRSLTPGDR